MKKIYYFLGILFLMSIMFTNLNLTLKNTSNTLTLHDLEALGQIYDYGDLPNVTIYCAATDDKCFTPSGCRCYKSTFGKCPEEFCKRWGVYYCDYTGTTTDICGRFILDMQNIPGAHAITCRYY